MIKKFENFNNTKTFSDVEPYRLCLMSKDEVVDVISNTYKSKVILSNSNRTIVESEWKHIKNSDETENFTKEIIGKTYKVYFHILESDFLILRSKDPETLEKLFIEIKNKYPEITNSGITKPRGLYKYHSTVLKGRMFPMLFFSMVPIIEGDEVFIDGEFYSLNIFFGRDVTIFESKMDTLSNLFVGMHLRVLKKQGVEINKYSIR